MNYVVTGATGFIGLGLAKGLKKSGKKVRALVRRTSNVGPLGSSGIQTVNGDILDKQSLLKVFASAHVVVHCAAKVGDWGRYVDFRETNITGTRNVLDSAVDCGVKRLLYVSTVDVFGSPVGAPVSEKSPFGHRPGPYGKTKQAAELIVREYAGSRRLNITTIYPSWVFGPGDRNFLPEIADALRTKSALFFGKQGKNIIELEYIENLVSAVLFLLDREETKGEGYILSDPEKISLCELFNTVALYVNAPEVKTSLPYGVVYAASGILEAVYRLSRIKKRPLITRHIVSLMGKNIRYDTSKLFDLGWKQPVPLREALQRTLESMTDRRPCRGKSIRD